jgi:hypothetical protein
MLRRHVRKVGSPQWHRYSGHRVRWKCSLAMLVAHENDTLHSHAVRIVQAVPAGSSAMSAVHVARNHRKSERHFSNDATAAAAAQSAAW